MAAIAGCSRSFEGARREKQPARAPAVPGSLRREPAGGSSVVGLPLRVVVEAAPALLAQAAGLDHLLEERRRGEALLSVFVEHDVGDVVGRVEADEIK